MSPPSGLRSTPDTIRAPGTMPRRARWAAYLAAIAISAALAAAPGLGFSSSVTQRLIERYAARFGPDARDRISGWQEFMRSMAPQRSRLADNDPQLLGEVNAFINHLRFVPDQAHWGVEDYWASPAEAFASDGADCEDFSIAKYFALKELGVPIRRLRITYVKAVRLNQAHMVLAYYPEPNAVPLILDNLEDSVRLASERPDLIPVYSFNDEDVLIMRQGKGNTRAGSASQIRLWRGLLDKLEQELRY